jgi:methionine-rich copper-binding protein CopC
VNNGAAGTLEGATALAVTTPTEMNFACALKSNGLMRYVTNLNQCKKTEDKVTIKPGPVLTCVQPDGSVRKVSSFSKCKSPATRLTLPPTSGTTYFCAATSTGVLRKVSDPSQCTSSEFPVFVTPNDAAPSVSSTLPTKDADHIAVNKNIDITFSESVSATTSSFTLVCGGVSKTFTLSGSPGSSLTLDPTDNLPEGTSCTVTALANQISDTDTLDPPDNMSANHTFSFTTDSAPIVTSTNPDDGVTGVDPSGDLTVNFSEPVNASGSSFTLECPTGTTESFSVSGEGTDSITLNPDADLPGATVCKITVLAAGISDVDGGDPPDNLAANHVSTFTTADAAPSVTSTTPEDTADHIAVDTNVTVDFSEPVNASTSSFTLECPSGSGVNFTVDGSGTNSITLDPDSNLPEGTTCDVQVIADQISDTDGVDPPDNMAANHNFSFTTDSAPAFTGSTPSDGASDVEPSANITIDFDEPVDVDTDSFTLLCEGNAQPFTVSDSGTSSITLDPDSDLPETANCTVSTVATNISDSDGGDPPDNPNQNTSFSFTTQDAAPSVTTTSPEDGASDVARDTNIDITFSEPVSATGDSFTLECPSGTAETFVLSGSGTSFTLDPDANLPAAETCTVKVIADQISDTDTVDPPDNMAADDTVSFTVAANLAPTDIALDNSSVDENQPSGTTVGTLSSTDPDAGDTFTYDFATGTGDTDNASFTIDGDTLKTNDTFDFETKSSYSILVKTTDSGGLSFDKQFTITINNVNDAPTDISLSNDSIDENEPSGTTIGTLSATDDDSGQTHDFTLENSGCNGSFPDNDSFSISGTDLQSAASFDFEDKNSYTICVRTTDSGSPVQSFDKQLTITINDVNDPPVVTTSTGGSTFTEDGPPVTVDDGLTVADADSPDLTGATVSITSNFASSQDELHFTDTAEIKGSYDATTGVLTLSGTATKAQYESALRSVTYSNTSQNPSGDARTISFEVDDGSASSDAATKSVNVTPVNDAPALTQPDGDLSYTEDTPSENHQLAIAPNLSVSDVDSTTIQSATVQITGNYHNGQDVLSFAAANGISGNFDASSGKLTLTHSSGTKTLAEYEAALRSVMYSNTSEDTSADKRTVTFQANDGGQANNLSNTPTRDITVTPTNDAPVAVADSFTSSASSALANTTMTVGTTVSEPHTSSSGNPLSNDTDVDSPSAGFTATSVTNAATTRGGRVTINSDGTFTYRPPPGITTNGGSSPDDTFTYTLHDNDNPDQTATGTVSVRIVGPTPWYVDDSAAAGGNGTSGAPFQSLGPLSSGGGSDTLDGDGDRIFVYSGTYTSGIVLENNQKLLGEPQGLSFTDNNGRSQSLVPAGGTAPAISSSSGPVVGLASGNELQDLSLGNVGSNATSLSGTNVGTATVADSSINTNGKAIDINTGTLAMTLGSVSSAGSGSEGIKLTNVGGSLAINGGSLTNATNADVAISQGSPNFSYGGSITDDQGPLVSIANTTGGTKSFTGAITDGNDGDGSGVSLTGNSGGTTSFSGGLVLSTGANPAFTATGGGTVNVTGTANTIATTTGTALNVANTTIGGSGLTFRSISANGATNGIVLNNTGSSGGLTVTGNGGTCTSAATCTGGAIQNATATGISLTSVPGSVSLTRMFVNDSLDDGIGGANVTGLTLDNATVTSNGNANGDNGIDFTQLTGTSPLTNSNVSSNFDSNVFVSNASGVLNLNVTGGAYSGATGGQGDGIFVEGTGTGSQNLNVQGPITFANNVGDHIQHSADADNTTDSDVTINNATMTSPPAAGGGPTCANNILGGGIVLSHGGNVVGGSNLDATVTNNNIQNSCIGAIAVGTSGSVLNQQIANVDATIQNNIIGTAGVAGSGSVQGNGIFVDSNGNSVVRTLITGNAIRQWTNRNGIALDILDGDAEMNATIRNNVLTEPNSAFTGTTTRGMTIQLGSGQAGDSIDACLDIGHATDNALKNQVFGTSEAPQPDIRYLHEGPSSVVQLAGYSGPSAPSIGDIRNYLQPRNNLGGTPSVSGLTAPAGSTTTSVASCPLPAG